MKTQQDARILDNRRIQGDYFQVALDVPAMASHVQPGQFVHVRLPALRHRVLRRPFSVYDVDVATGQLRIVYKVVGEGTAHLATLGAGAVLNVMGPMGCGFTLPLPGERPVIVAGGYGAAATYLLAKRSPVPCLCLVGGRTAGDLLLLDEFRAVGATVRVATDDGSCGHHGVITEVLPTAIAEAAPRPLVYACGPNPMLAAVGRVVAGLGLDAEISLDHVMCCGVGACFACVVKMKADNADGWEYVRTCRNGPVFKASAIWWD